MIRQYSSYFLKDIRNLVKDDSVQRDDVKYLLRHAGVTPYEDKKYNVDDVRSAFTYNAGDIIKTWKAMKIGRQVQMAARQSADRDRSIINRQKPMPSLNTPDRKEKKIEEPDSYMPGADMDKVSLQCLKDQDVFYDHDSVPDDRSALESLVKKYGKTDVLHFIEISETKK